MRRTIALLVDDLKMSFEGVSHTREALAKFVDRQMQPGDLVAVIPTSGGIGALQQFTTDKRMLHAAIDRVRYQLGGGGQGGAVKALGGAGQDIDPAPLAALLQRRFAVGTLGAMRHLASGMRNMPGRKSIVVFSDGFAIRRNIKQQDPPVTVAEARQVTDRANRSAVTIYAVDTRGLAVTSLRADDDVQGMEVAEVTDALEDRGQKFRDDRQGLEFLAAETGGLARFNDNDINAGLVRMLADQSGYYLIGFQPDEACAADQPRREISPPDREGDASGLNVRYRKGYMGETGPPEKEPRTPGERLLAALNSPSRTPGVRVRFTPTFTLGDRGQLAIRALLHVDGSDVSFSPPDAEGARTARVHMLTVTESAGESTPRSFTACA